MKRHRRLRYHRWPGLLGEPCFSQLFFNQLLFGQPFLGDSGRSLLLQPFLMGALGLVPRANPRRTLGQLLHLFS
ncbi:MAG: hypothetical protein FJW39_08350 [Acidobacteria bacterium]|nr:hypothetical protein [Acidobacteriota bacterium]